MQSFPVATSIVFIKIFLVVIQSHRSFPISFWIWSATVADPQPVYQGGTMIRNALIPFVLFVLFALLSGCATSRVGMRPYERGEVAPLCTSTICPSILVQRFLADFWKDTADGQGIMDEFITIFNDQYNHEGWRFRLPSADELGHRSHDKSWCDEAVEFILTYRPEDAQIRPLYHGQVKWTVCLRAYPNPYSEWDGSNMVYKADEVIHLVEFDVWDVQTSN